MKDDFSLKLLKFFVKFTGAILVLGTIALFGMIVYKIQSGSTKKEVQTACAYSGGGVSVKSEVISATVTGNILTLLTKQDKGTQETVLVDICTGQVLSSFTLNDVRFSN